jgi:hypothetical protein
MASSRRKGVEVWTFDKAGIRKNPPQPYSLPTDKEKYTIFERHLAFRGKSEEEWEQDARNVGVGKIKFHNLNLLTISDSEFNYYMATWLIVLDTYHKPDTAPFEREFMARIVKLGYRGIIVLDDIHLNSEMRSWWAELQENSEKWGFKAYDISDIGHKSGTGLLDFSGSVHLF